MENEALVRIVADASQVAPATDMAKGEVAGLQEAIAEPSSISLAFPTVEKVNGLLDRLIAPAEVIERLASRLTCSFECWQNA